MIKLKILKNPLRFYLDFFEGEIKYPVDVFFLKKNGKISWQTKITSPGMWCQSPSSIPLDVRVIDCNDDLIFSYNSIYSEFSDIVEKKFIDWCRTFISINGNKPKGIAIGTNDGSTGEWVEAYNQNLIGETLLIEPNLNSFLQLTTRYSNDKIFSFKKCVVSESDGELEFYTDLEGSSEASSLSKDHYLNHQNNFQIVKVKSYTLKSLIGSKFPDWIHIDAEGYDGKIITSFDDTILSNIKFLLWEHIHLNDDVSDLIRQRLQKFGFEILKGESYNTCAFKMV